MSVYYCKSCGKSFDQTAKAWRCPFCDSDDIWFEMTSNMRIWTFVCIFVGAASIIGAIVYTVLNQ